jgi:hypothetical protein
MVESDLDLAVREPRSGSLFNKVARVGDAQAPRESFTFRRNE